MIAALVAVVVLLGWDYAEISVANVLTLKGRIERQEERQASTEQEIANVRLDVAQATATVNARLSQDLTQQFDFNLSFPDPTPTREALPGRLQTFQSSLAQRRQREGLLPDQGASANQRIELLDRAERLRPLTVRRSESLSPIEQEFVAEFRRELQVVQGVRNRIAHAESVASDDVTDALAIANELIEFLDRIDWE